MDRAIKEKWVVALRSGEFEQGHLELFKDGKYCCLAVLLRVMGTVLEERDVRYHLLGEFGFDQAMTEKFWAFNDGLPHKKLKPHSFRWIAAYIERWL